MHTDAELEPRDDLLIKLHSPHVFMHVKWQDKVLPRGRLNHMTNGRILYKHVSLFWWWKGCVHNFSWMDIHIGLF